MITGIAAWLAGKLLTSTGIVPKSGILIVAGVLALVAILIGSLGTLAFVNHGLRSDLREAQKESVACTASIVTAEAESKATAAVADAEAAATMTEKAHEDRPAVERVVTRIVRQCAPASDLPVPAAPAGAGQAGGEAQDDRGFAADLAGDLETCQSELNRLDVMRDWIKANSGG